MKTFGKGFTNCGKRKGTSTENCPLSYSNFCDHLIVAKISSPPPTLSNKKNKSTKAKVAGRSLKLHKVAVVEVHRSYLWYCQVKQFLLQETPTLRHGNLHSTVIVRINYMSIVRPFPNSNLSA